MSFANLTVGRRGFAGLLAGAALAIGLGVTACQTTGGVARGPIDEGQKIVMATHSFNVFISTDPNRARGRGGAQAASNQASVPLLTMLTNERGITGQEFLAVQMIGGSTPMQHWNQGGADESKNIAKAALRKGGVDVFTMSPNAIMPEEGIDHFGDFVIATNPNARILVQNSWSAYDGKGSTPSVGGTGGGSFKNAERDLVTLEQVEEWIAAPTRPGSYIERMRTQLRGINQRAGREMAFVVPSNDAVLQLRKLVIEGKIPGVTKQSELYADPIGHATPPTRNLVAYVWFAAMYRQSPIGLQALVDPSDPTSPARERILQQIAWNAVVSEPMSGVNGRKVAVGEGVTLAGR